MRFAAPNQTGEEAKLVAVARQLRALNSSVSIYFYLNTMMDWSQFDLHAWLASQHPEWWVQNERGKTVCLGGQPLFNQSIAGMRAAWVGTMTKALGSGLYQGVFADRANQLPTGNQQQPGPGQATLNGIYNAASGACASDGLPPFRYSAEAYRAWGAGHAAVLRDAQAAARSLAVIANNNATADVGGRQFERWCRGDFDRASIEQDIAQLQAASVRVAFHTGRSELGPPRGRADREHPRPSRTPPLEALFLLRHRFFLCFVCFVCLFCRASAARRPHPFLCLSSSSASPPPPRPPSDRLPGRLPWCTGASPATRKRSRCLSAPF